VSYFSGPERRSQPPHIVILFVARPKSRDGDEGARGELNRLTKREDREAMLKIHGDYHGHWVPYFEVTYRYTWDNTSCPSCRRILAQAISYADSFGDERIQVLVRDNHLILKRVISEWRVPSEDDEDN